MKAAGALCFTTSPVTPDGTAGSRSYEVQSIETLRCMVGEVTTGVLQNERLVQRPADFVRRQAVSGQTVW